MRRLLASAAALLLAAPAVAADPPAWIEPTAPFRISGNIYYVGTKGLAAYLITSNRGLILIDGTLEGNVPFIERSIARLGFRLSDVKLLLSTHAHFDHAAGLAQLKRDTGATFLASAGDRAALESGTPPSETSYGVVTFPPVKVDRVLVDGQPVRLGNVALTPLITPGHTPGCTSWTMISEDALRPLRVVFPCSLSVAGNKLAGNAGYPDIVADYRRSFARLRDLPADAVLPAHPELVNVIGRGARRAQGDDGAFFMPGVLFRMVRDAQAAFEAELAAATAPASAAAH